MAKIPTENKTVTMEIGMVALAEYSAEHGAADMVEFADIMRNALSQYTGYERLRPQLAYELDNYDEAAITPELVRRLVRELMQKPFTPRSPI
jgi:hypothetical protein